MAISKDIILNNGLTVNKAYIRIDTVNGYKGGLDISVNSYISQDAFMKGQGYMEQKMYNFVPSVEDTALNFIKQGYEYLKTLEEYRDAVDLLDEGQAV